MKKRTKSTKFKFQPFSLKQKKLLMWWTDKSPYKDYDMIICHGAIRSGKTIAMIDSFITWSLAKHQHQSFIMASKSMGALKRNVLKPMFEILTAKGIDYHYHRSGDPYVSIGTNTYYLFGANNESSQDTLQGLTAAGAYLDEVALFPRSFVEQAMGRCSAETNDQTAKVFLNCNPEGPYHWFKKDYIDKAEEKKILVLHFKMDDNLSLSTRVKKRFERMFSGIFYQRFIKGQWVLAEGIIYSMFDKKIHSVKTVDRPYIKYFISVDYGTLNPTTFGLWGKHDGVWYKVKEFHHSGRGGVQKTDKEYSAEMTKFKGNLPATIIVDPAAASFKVQLTQDGHRVIDANNAVIDGIRNVASSLIKKSILYNDCCKETFREYSSYIWDEKRSKKGEDKPVKENDHHMDGDRYFVNTVIFGQTKVKISDKRRLGVR